MAAATACLNAAGGEEWGAGAGARRWKAGDRHRLYALVRRRAVLMPTRVGRSLAPTSISSQEYRACARGCHCATDQTLAPSAARPSMAPRIGAMGGDDLTRAKHHIGQEALVAPNQTALDPEERGNAVASHAGDLKDVAEGQQGARLGRPPPRQRPCPTRPEAPTSSPPRSS